MTYDGFQGGLWARAGLSLLALGLGLIAAGCGGDDGDEAPAAQPAEAPAEAPAEETPTEAPAEEAPATQPEAEPMEAPGMVMNFPAGVDVNGDGHITIGHVMAGDRKDGGFYQGQADAVVAFAEANGHTAIVVDQINPGAAREAFENLARQGVDLIIGGGPELRDGFIPVSEDPTFSAINFILVAGFPPTSDGYATAAASESEAHFMGGVAAGLLLERTGATTACITAGPELDFVRNMAASMNAGLAHLQDSYAQAAEAEMLVAYTGDSEDAALAREAATAQIDQGCGVIYPYLGIPFLGGGLPAGVVDLDAEPADNLARLASAKGVGVSDIVACILNRPRHETLIARTRAAGARIRLIQDGDIAGVIATSSPGAGVDIYLGSGGAPEGVLAAAALRCIGGQMMGRLIFRNDDERGRARKLGIDDLNRKYALEELASGDVIFAATGVTDGAMLRGVRRSADRAETESLIMRSTTGTVRTIRATHDFTRKAPPDADAAPQ